jgi:hypothetical protein
MPNPQIRKRFHLGPGVVSIPPWIPEVCRRFRLCDASFIPSAGGHTDWPGRAFAVRDHSRHAHWLVTGCRSACRHVRPSSRETSTRPIPRPSPASAHPLMRSGPAGTCSSSPGTRISQLRGSDDNENAVARRCGVGVGLGRKDAIVAGLEVVFRRAGLHGDGVDPLDAASPDISRHHHAHRATVDSRSGLNSALRPAALPATWPWTTGLTYRTPEREGPPAHIGCAERHVQTVMIGHAGGLENICRPRVTPFGGRDRPCAQGSLPGHRAHVEQFSAPIACACQRRNNRDRREPRDQLVVGKREWSVD